MVIQKNITSLLNRILINNKSGTLLLKRYANKSLKINIIGAISLSVQINDSGCFEPIDLPNEHNAEIIFPITTGFLLINNQQTEILKQISILGDKKFAIDVLSALSSLEIVGSIYEDLTFPLNIGFKLLLNILTSIKNTFTLILNNAGTSISEYLQFETQQIVTKKN